MTGEGAAQRWRWSRLAWIIPAALLLMALVVVGAHLLRASEFGSNFIAAYPGTPELPSWAPVGFPAWLAWQHGINAVFLLLLVRTGWLVRTQRRPEAFWTRKNTGVLRTKGAPQKISLMLWLHLSIDALWLLNGVVFFVLLFATGQWARIVPTGWDVFPHALSAGLQYASLQWPTENGWAAYNGLQLLSYFAVVFVAAPLSFITGIRMSALWPANAQINRLYPVRIARAVHFPVMLFFVLFIIVHVTLVLATGALRNLNHMYATRDDQGWAGFIIFAVSLVVMVVASFAARPLLVAPVASLTGRVTPR